MKSVREFTNQGNLGVARDDGRIPLPRGLNLKNKFSSRPNSSKIYVDSNHKNEEKLCSKSDFVFKHLTQYEIEAAVKRVRRANQKKRDEERWTSFVQSRKESKHEENCDELLSARKESCCAECGRLEPELNGPVLNNQEEIPTEVDANTAEDIQLSAEKVNENISHTYQIGPGLSKRLQDLLFTVRKMTAQLMSPCLQEQYEDEDVERTIKRSLEFDAMFARNHLYEIQRVLKDTKQLAIAKAPSTSELESKISAALKSVTQALQVYIKHVSKGSRVKYQQVLPIFQSITTIHSLLERLTGQQLFTFRRDIEVSCSYMKQILLEISTTKTKSVSTVSHKPAKMHHKHKPSADLSMYNRRRNGEWRRKATSLARARFGAPTKKNLRRSASAAEKIDPDNKLKTGGTGNESTCQANNNKLLDKGIAQTKEPTNTKDAPHRNATRAVPEEHVTTMMEMIPHEPLDDADLSIDDNAFQVLNLLKKAAPEHVEQCLESIVNNQKSETTSKIEEKDRKRPSSAISAREPTNVQLLCIKEDDSRHKKPAVSDEEAKATKDKSITLTIDDATREEALEYHRKVTEFQNSNPNYKDGKALGILDRLTNQILSEMILDFQRNEMEQVIRTLYNLEFE